MAGAKFQYDESGGTFFYFLLSFLALIVIPCTYYFWPDDGKNDHERRDKKSCHCHHCSIKISRLRAREPWRKAKNRLIKFLLVLGWLALMATGYKVTQIQHDYVAWDPFEILQIDPASSMSEIKKAYHKLSLVYHPDKATGDEKKFMMIAKAYAALTDDESRKNWEMYGNPDGPGATSFGIALPSWIVEKENSVWVLGLYALVFMVALPVGVGIWWYRSVKFGGDQVLLDTTQLYYYFIHKTSHMVLKRVLMILASSLEFEHSHNSEVVKRPSDNIEMMQLIRELPNLSEKNKERPLCFEYSIKARALLHAHLSRMELNPHTLDQDRLYIVKKCPYLLQEFVQCVSQMTMLALTGRIARQPSLDTMENAMKLCPMIVQALWENKSPLLQLPHINEDMLRHFNTRKRNIKNIKQLSCMKADERRSMLRSLSDEQYNDIMNVLSKMPILEMEVKSEVLDDEDSCTITAGAIVTVSVTLIRQDFSTIFEQEYENNSNALSQAQDDGGNAEAKEEGQAQQPPASNQQSKLKVWQKQPKKKGRGGKSKKKPAKVQTRKPVQGQKGVAENAVSDTKETKNKDSDDESADGSDVESDGGGSSQSAESNNEKEDADEAKEEVLNNKNKSSSKGGGVEGGEEDEAEWVKIQQKMTKKEKVLETKSKRSHTVHCPFFPEDKQEYWWIYIADRKKHSLITVPYLMTNLVEKEEVDLKFTAPNKSGLYNYSVIVRSDSYIDFDLIKNIKLDVKEAKIVDQKNSQWDHISDEEEDKEDDEDSAVEDSDLSSGLDDDDD